MKEGNDTPYRTALSPDGKIAVLAGMTEFKHSNWARLYDTASHRLLHEITSHQAPIDYLLFSPDGKQLLTQDQDGGTLISEVSTGREIKWLTTAKKRSGYNGENQVDVFSAWSKDGKQLVSQPNMYNSEPAAQRMWRIWDLNTGAVRTLSPISIRGGDAIFDDDGNVVTAETENKQIQVRRLNTKDGRQISSTNFGEGLSAKLSPDGHFLLSTVAYGRDRSPRATEEKTGSELWDVAKHRKLANLSGLMWNSVFSGDGKTLVTSDDKGTIALRDLTPGRYGTIRRELPPFASGELDYLAVSNDANWIFTIDSWTPARLWNLREALTPLRYPLKTTLSAFNSPKTRVIEGGFRTVYGMGAKLEIQEVRDGTLKSWQIALKDDHKFLETLEIAPGGKFLATHWRKENKIEIYDLDLKALTSTWRAPEKLLGISFSPDGSRFAEASTEGEIKVHDVTGTIFQTWDAAAGSLEKIEWSPDGTSIATLGDGVLTLWDAKTGKEKKTLAEVNARLDFAWSPDSRTIVTATGPKDEKYHCDQLLIVDTEQGEVTRRIPLPSPKKGIAHLKFSPDGTVVSVTQALSLSLFHVADGSEVPAPNDDCPVFDFDWITPSELSIDAGTRLKIWQMKPERLARKPQD